VEGTVCRDWVAKFFPPRADCAKCFSKNTDWFEMPQKGKTRTFTTAYMPFGFETDPPTPWVVVDLEGV